MVAYPVAQAFRPEVFPRCVMVAVETKKLTENLLATRQEIVNPGVSYRITPSREILVLEKNGWRTEARTFGVSILEVRWKSFCPDAVLPRERLVGKLWRVRGKALERLCMKAREVFLRPAKRTYPQFARGNPLHTARKNSAPGDTQRRFPPIHNGHHNNKGRDFVFEMYLL